VVELTGLQKLVVLWKRREEGWMKGDRMDEERNAAFYPVLKPTI